MDKRQFLAGLAMGIIILVYAVWSGRAASDTFIFFLIFPALCGGGRDVAKHPWLRWVLWPAMILTFCIVMLDLGMSRADDPWFSSSLHRTMIGVVGAGALVSGCMVRRAVCKAMVSSSPPMATQFRLS